MENELIGSIQTFESNRPSKYKTQKEKADQTNAFRAKDENIVESNECSMSDFQEITNFVRNFNKFYKKKRHFMPAKTCHKSPFMTRLSHLRAIIYVGVKKSLKNVSYKVISFKTIYDKKATYTISEICQLRHKADMNSFINRH